MRNVFQFLLKRMPSRTNAFLSSCLYVIAVAHTMRAIMPATSRGTGGCIELANVVKNRKQQNTFFMHPLNKLLVIQTPFPFSSYDFF